MDDRKYRQRQPDPEMLEHERKRKIELEVFELRDKLEEDGKLEEDEIDDQCEALRRKLEAYSEAENAKASARGLKGHQVHDMAKAKIEESERMRRALGIREDYEEGGHWKRQDGRLRNTLADKAKDESRTDHARQEPAPCKDRRRRSDSYDD
jgi:hypothetical protein